MSGNYNKIIRSSKYIPTQIGWGIHHQNGKEQIYKDFVTKTKSTYNLTRNTQKKKRGYIYTN